MATTKAEVVLSVVDRITGPIKAIQNRIDRLTAPVRRVARAIGDFGRAAGIDRLASRFQNLGASISNVAGRVSVLAAGLAGVAAIGIGAGVSQFVSVNSSFEKYNAILETVLGSSEKASKAMDWVSAFATKTPYELSEVTDSFVKLTSYGIDPMAGTLEAAGNAAAAMGKTVNDAVEAVADAMTGENERLKEFGITTEKTGNKIKYNWVENGKQMTAYANKNSRKQIEAVIKGIWNRQYSGAMDKLSGTWDGMVSNLSDTWARFVLKIGDAGAFDRLKGIIADVLKWFNRMGDEGKLDAWAKGISEAMSGVMDQFRDFLFGYDVLADSLGATIHVPGFLEELPKHLKAAGEWMTSVVTGFRDFYAALQPAIDLLGGPGNAALITLGAITFGPLIASLATLGASLLGLVAAVSLPVAATIGALALFGGAVYALIAKWDEFVAYWAGLWKGVAAAFDASWTSGILATLSAFNPVTHVMVGMNALFAYFSGINLLAEGDRIIASLAAGIAGGAGKLYEAGVAAVQGLLDGIAAKFEELKAYISNAIAEIAAMMPEWAQGAIGGIGQSMAAPGLSTGPTEPPSILGKYLKPRGSLLDEPGPLNLPNVAPTPAPSVSATVPSVSAPAMPLAPSSTSSITTSEVTTSTVSIGSASFPEPIIANQPQVVNAPYNGGGVVVNVQGMTKEEGQAMVSAALQNAAAQHAANLRSALND